MGQSQKIVQNSNKFFCLI